MQFCVVGVWKFTKTFELASVRRTVRSLFVRSFVQLVGRWFVRSSLVRLVGGWLLYSFAIHMARTNYSRNAKPRNAPTVLVSTLTFCITQRYPTLPLVCHNWRICEFFLQIFFSQVIWTPSYDLYFFYLFLFFSISILTFYFI